ncbi:MAG TPA: hypothetical protein ENI80_11035 [Acidiferrobacteraceae bacterium]|nr:hypothetical protein [Acidiferrobacteraceae bacterium]
MKLRLLSNLQKILLGFIGFGIASFGYADLFSWGTPIAPAQGWQYRVYAEDLPHIDNIDLDRHGNLYATLERGKGRGKLVRIGKPSHKVMLAELNRPDGLVVVGDKLYLVEETMQGRIIELNLGTGLSRTLARLDMTEGIEPLPGGGLVLSQDMGKGGLVHLDLDDGKLTPLYGGLVRPEGLAVDRHGGIFVAETGTGRVIRIFKGKLTVVVANLNEPDQLLLQADGSLWISEDSKDGRLLRLKENRLKVIMEHLESPQGMVFTPKGVLLLAEQGRDRILAIEQTASTTKN